MSEPTAAMEAHPAWASRIPTVTGAGLPAMGTAVAQPSPVKKGYQCPQCDRPPFESKRALGAHLWGAHQVEGTTRKKGPAKRKAEAETKVEQDPKAKGACPVCGSVMLTANIARHINRSHTKTIDVTVDDIFVSVTEMLFPDNVPTDVLPELLAWRDATKRLLDSLVSS
jgi:hypothetical protein